MKWVRVRLSWAKTETARGVFQWDRPYDDPPASSSARERILNAYNAGFSVLATIQGTPAWAQCLPDGSGCPANPDVRKPPKLADYFREFTAAAAREFGCHVAAWEVWNEPNYTGFWTGTRNQYRDLILAPGYDGIKSERPRAIVVAPSTLHNSNDDALDIDDWIKEGGSLVRPLDYVSLHAYGSRSKQLGWLDLANAYCGPKWWCLGFWVTEFGFSTNDPLGQDSAPGDALRAMLNRCNNLTWCWKAFIFSLHDGVGDGNTDFGLLKANGTPKPRFCTVEQYVTGRQVPPCPVN